MTRRILLPRKLAVFSRLLLFFFSIQFCLKLKQIFLSRISILERIIFIYRSDQFLSLISLVQDPLAQLD